MPQDKPEKDLWPEDVEERFDKVRDLEDRDFQAELVRGQIVTARARLREARQQNSPDVAALQAALDALIEEQERLLLSL